MFKRQDRGMRIPYETPETEVLVVSIEEQFMESPFNTSNNEMMSRGLDEDFD